MKKQNQFTEEKGKPEVLYFSVSRAPRNLIAKKGFIR